MYFYRTIFFFLLLFSSCKVTEENIVGTYYLKESPKTKLVLNKDKTFVFVKNFSKPGIEVFPDSTDRNFRTTGNWQLNEKKQLILNSFPNKYVGQAWTWSVIAAKDTSITSLSFWDIYDEPVPIRFIKFPNDRIKFHLNNSISFFANDFNKIDTLEFHFYGYRPYTWPNMQYNYESNNHLKIILNEEPRVGVFKDIVFLAQRKKLIDANKQFSLKKSQ
jgi:hypothetical protein